MYLIASGLLFVTLLAPTSSPGAVVETATYRLEFPQGWSKVSGTTPTRVTGPDQTTVTISSHAITGDPNDKGASQARASIEAGSKEAVSQVIASSQMQVQMPWRKVMLADGSALHETIAMSKDHRRYLANLLLVGKRSVVAVSVEGPGQAVKRYATVREAVAATVWR